MSIATHNTFSEDGLDALFDQIKANRDTGEANASSISGLGEDLAGLAEETVSALNGKQDKLTGIFDQIVGFDVNGNPCPIDPNRLLLFADVASDGSCSLYDRYLQEITIVDLYNMAIANTTKEIVLVHDTGVFLDLTSYANNGSTYVVRFNGVSVSPSLTAIEVRLGGTVSDTKYVVVETPLATIDDLPEGGTPIVTATSTDGVTYTATVDGMNSLVVGKEIMLVPDTNSAAINPKLNVNGLGDKYLRCPVTSNNTTTTTGASATWLYAGKPVKVRWNGTFWVTDIPRVDATTLYNAVPIEKGGTGATDVATALTNLGFTTESWTFTLADGSTVTKSMAVIA